VVVVLALEVVNVQGDAGLRRKGLHDVRDHLARKLAYLFAHEVELNVRRGPRGNVDDSARERLVERAVRMPESPDVATVPQRLVEGLADDQRTVLGGVVVADVQVALALEREVDAPVLGHGAEHVVEEADACVNVVLAGAVHVDLARNVRLLSLARHCRGASHRTPAPCAQSSLSSLT
jgi:hypothetical protein